MSSSRLAIGNDVDEIFLIFLFFLFYLLKDFYADLKRVECAHACRVCACVQSVRMRDFTVPSDERPGNKDDSTVPAFAISGKTSTRPTCQYSIDIFHIKTSKYSRLQSRSWKSRTMLTQTPRVADIWQGAK